MTGECYRLLERYMLDCMADAAHDRAHVYRVLYQALDIAQTVEGVDYDVLIAAALLHDIGRKAQLADPTLCHAQVGGEMAHRFLLAQGFAPDFADAVRHCIVTHRYRSDAPPLSQEAKLLFDADKLDVSGAMGIARSLQYGAVANEPLYSLRPDGSVSDGVDDAAESFFREYHFKLKRVGSGFHTARAAALAQERHAAAEAFYESLYHEAREAYRGQEMLERLLAQGEGAGDAAPAECTD